MEGPDRRLLQVRIAAIHLSPSLVSSGTRTAVDILRGAAKLRARWGARKGVGTFSSGTAWLTTLQARLERLE